MKMLTLERKVDSPRPVRSTASRPAPEILAQRSSTLGPGGSVAAPAIVDAGRPLDGATRHTMEGGFGRDFSGIRVHDDARAHDDARSLGARAYAAGDHIVFGEGAYRPETHTGRALIAHELAHSVQQGGVQMKADGSIPAARDAELEAQADRAALDVTAGRRTSGLNTIGRAAIFRANGDPPASPPATTSAAAGSGVGLPSDVTLIEETPPGSTATKLIVELPVLTLPRVKGKGAWVQQSYDALATGKRLVFSPIFDAKKYEDSSTIAAFMEKPGDKYKDIWLNNYGFKDLKGLGKQIRASAGKPEVKAVLDNPDANTVVAGFEKGTLTAAGCDIDHIVEKQIGGASVASNLQVLLSGKNQESGRETYQMMVSEVKRILENRPDVVQFQMRFKTAVVPPDVEDASYLIEDLLRKNHVQGAPEVMAKAAGTPVMLFAGGVSEVVRVGGPKERTPIDIGERRLIAGMKLKEYERGQTSTPTSGRDTVTAELASKPVTSASGSVITLFADVMPKPTTPDPTSAGASAAEKAAATEARVLKLDPTKNLDVKFFYPYLSPGKFTTLAVDDQNRLTGEGVITPSVKFLGELKVKFGPDTLALVQNINTDAINSSAFVRPIATMFRFTSGSVSIDLLKFKPEGNLELELGPKGKPVILGTINATEESGHFVAKGTLRPGGSLPGIKEAKGEVTYRSDTGWSGLLEASSTSIPNSTASVRLGFKEERGAFRPYAEGGITTTIRNSNLNLNVRWNGGAVGYSGGVRIEKPMPLVQSVNLTGGYSEGQLKLTGEAPIKWKTIDSMMSVTYIRKDGEEGTFSGTATLGVKTEKAEGSLKLTIDPDGTYSGVGTLSYQVTKDIRPQLGLEISRNQRVRMFGEVALADIPLTRMWPSPNGGKLDFIKGVGAKFPFPLPPPVVGVSAFIEIRASAGLGYGVGPLTLKGLLFKGELYPLEDDPKVVAGLKGKLVVPGYAEIWGTLGAYIGLEVLAGAAGVKGGIDVTPSLRVTGEAGIETVAEYKEDAFTFFAEAYARGQMDAGLKVDLVAQVYALYGVLEHTWTYNAVGVRYPLGPELKLIIGRIEYGKNGEITWPNLSQMSLEPKNLDPATMINEMLGRGKTTKV